MSADELTELRRQVALLSEQVAALQARSATQGWAPPAIAGLYAGFQDRFRGDRDEIRRRLRIYLPEAARVHTGLPMLDVGPGRGEWLGLLAEHDLPGYGVEADARFVDSLRAAGFQVVHASAMAHLEELEPGSLDLVSAFHVIEHLEMDALVTLLSSSRRALRPGGALLLETPNPANLVMGACNFYLDPTHLRPLPPALTEFLVAAAGFVDVEVRPLHPREVVDAGGLQFLGVDRETSDLLAAAVTKAFFGPQDYAVVAAAP